MDERKFEIIQQLMDELKEEMSYGAEDLGERLGRPKPKVEMMSVEAESPEMEGAEEMMGMDLDSDMEMDEDPAHKAKVMGQKSLKDRLMKMRGA